MPILNNGVIEAPVGGLLNIDNGGTAVTNTLTTQNNGIISANGGRIDLDFAPPPFGRAPAETLINTGSVEITNDGSLALNGTFSGNSVTFSGKGALGLQVGNAFAGGSKVTGFGPGDQLDLYGLAKGSGSLAFAGGVLSLGTSSAVPLSGSLGLGNFESQWVGSNGSALTIAYAPDGGPSGIVQPDITAPASATVAQGSTLSLGGVSISGLGNSSNSLNISVGSGRLGNAGADSGGPCSLAYVPAAGATADTVAIGVSPPAAVASSRSIRITITSGGTGPGLHEPASETVAPGATVAVSGSYNDSFAQHNPGKLFLGISDNNGNLKATDASGNPVVGSGTNYIGLSTDYPDAHVVLKSLTYAAGSAGKDAISFDIWNQAGMETTGTVPVTIAAINKATLASTAGPFFFAAGPTMSSPADFSIVVSQAVAAMSGEFGAPSGTPGGATGWLPQPTVGGWLTQLFEQPPQIFGAAPHWGS